MMIHTKYYSKHSHCGAHPEILNSNLQLKLNGICLFGKATVLPGHSIIYLSMVTFTVQHILFQQKINKCPVVNLWTGVQYNVISESIIYKSSNLLEFQSTGQGLVSF